MECQLETLRKSLSVRAIRTALNELPSTLDDTYNQILNNIPKEYFKDAHRVLQLLAVSYRPLTIQEVAEAVAVDCENEIFDLDNRLRDPEDILEICSNLLILSGYVTLN